MAPARLGRWVHRRRRWVVAAWVALLGAGVMFGTGVMDRLESDPKPSTRFESARVWERLHDLSSNGGHVIAIIDGIDVADPRIRTQIERAIADVNRLRGVAGTMDHYSTGSPAFVATDGRATLIMTALAKDLTPVQARTVAHEVSTRFRAIEAPEVLLGGPILTHEEFVEIADRDLARADKIALPIALAAMVVIFGGLLAASLPIAMAVLVVAASLLVLLVASSAMSLSVFSFNVVVMLGLALGIDYGLLIVSRFREERAAGYDIASAVSRTVATAGKTVAFSALTVAVALLGLFVFDDPTFRSFGIAGIGVVLFSMAAGLTLLPALLSMWGRRIKPAKPRAGDHGYFVRVSRFVQRRAVVVVVIVGTGLAMLALPFLGARFESGDVRSMPRSSEVRRTAEVMLDRFPSRGADPIIIIAEGTAEEIQRYVTWLARLAGVAGVEVRHGTPRGITVIDVVPHGTSQGDVAQDLARRLRIERPFFPVEIGGTAATLIDFKGSIGERLPYALGVMGGATFVLLFLMTGSIAVPLKAIAMNLLSLGATFGALVWVFQEGHLSGILGFDPTGSLDVFMPVLIFIFAFGLSMDYEVFLLARIKEIYDETGDNDRAVSIGLQRTGKIITSAAALMVIVFGAFASSELLGIKQLGFGMALAVVVDATIVRTLLVPATMKLLGARNWWAPAPLRRIHERFGLEEGSIEIEPEPVAA